MLGAEGIHKQRKHRGLRGGENLFVLYEKKRASIFLIKFNNHNILKCYLFCYRIVSDDFSLIQKNPGGSFMNSKNIIFIIVMLSGLVIGGFLGEFAADIPFLSFLSYGKEVGLTSPIALDLIIIKLQIGFTLRFTIAGIIGMIISIFIYRKLW